MNTKRIMRVNVSLSKRSGSDDYPLIIGENALDSLKKIVDTRRSSRIVIIADTRVAKLWAPLIRRKLGSKVTILRVPSGEQQKTLKNVSRLWSELQSLALDRNALVLNLGGGATSDLGGFVASTYLRGVSFVNIPTTLLSQVDASVGGKVGINFEQTKNIIGNFAHPLAVIIDQRFLTTLSERELRSGLAEMIKHGIMFDSKHFERIVRLAPAPLRSKSLAAEICRSCTLKANVVEHDERERGERRLLNFGHTFGHAFEAISLSSAKPLLHGEAIAIGMLAEIALAEILGVANLGTFKQVERALKICKLPTRLPIQLGRRKSEILRKLQKDKKVLNGKLIFALPTKIGCGTVVSDVSMKSVIEALNSVIR